MKNIFAAILLICSVSLANSVFADTAKLRMNFSGKADHTYLCVNNLGCYKIGVSTNGLTLPVDVEEVKYLALANITNNRLYKQTIPASCAVTVNANQTLMISGHVTKTASDMMVIHGLHCSVV